MAAKRLPRKPAPKSKASSPRQGRGTGTGMRKTTSPMRGRGTGTGRKRSAGSKVVGVEDNDGGMYTNKSGEKVYGSSPRYRNPLVRAGVYADRMQGLLRSDKQRTAYANSTGRKGEAARTGRKPVKRTAPRRGTR